MDCHKHLQSEHYKGGVFMKGVIQCIENFFGQGTLGASEGKTLENAITRMNKAGWKIDQIVPLSFRPDEYSKGGMNVTSGILLCSKIE